MRCRRGRCGCGLRACVVSRRCRGPRRGRRLVITPFPSCGDRSVLGCRAGNGPLRALHSGGFLLETEHLCPAANWWSDGTKWSGGMYRSGRAGIATCAAPAARQRIGWPGGMYMNRPRRCAPFLTDEGHHGHGAGHPRSARWAGHPRRTRWHAFGKHPRGSASTGQQSHGPALVPEPASGSPRGGFHG